MWPFGERDRQTLPTVGAGIAFLASWRLGEKLKKAAMTENAIARQIVDAAFHIHTTLGPGLLESVYHAVLAYELAQRELRTVSQQAIPVVYGTIRLDTGFRADLIVEDRSSSRSNRSNSSRAFTKSSF
jgi:hypothetical protein